MAPIKTLAEQIKGASTAPFAAAYKRYVAEALAAFEAAGGVVAGDPADLRSPRVKEIEGMIDGFGCHAALVAKMLTALTGEKIEAKKAAPSGLLFPAGTFVVLLANPNSHSYAVNKPSLIAEWNGYAHHGITIGNAHNPSSRVNLCYQGNNMPSEARHYRRATLEEARAFAKRVADLPEGSFIQSA